MTNLRCLTCRQRPAIRRGCCWACWKKHGAGGADWPALAALGLATADGEERRARKHSALMRGK